MNASVDAFPSIASYNLYIMCEGKLLNSLEDLNKMLGRDLILSL